MTDTTNKAIGERLTQARRQAGLSISQVKRLYHNIADGERLMDAEIGRVALSDNDIDALSNIYFVDVRWLLTGETSLDVSEIEKYATKMSKEDRKRLIDLLSSLAREE